VIGQTKRTRRLIMASLRPLTGSRAVGVATANVRAGYTQDVCIPANAYAYPVLESAAGVGDVDDQRLIRTSAPVIVTPGSAKLVAITSMLGGEHQNLPANTRLLWDPPIQGLETHSTISTAMAGGLNPGTDHQAPIQDVVSYEEITAADVAQDLFLARTANRFPAVVIGWEGSEEGERKGRNMVATPELWSIFVVVSNQQGEQAARDQGLAILDAARDLLTDKKSVDGATFSDPPGMIIRRRRIATTPTSLVYACSLVTTVTAERLDLRTTLPPGFTRDPDQLPASDWDSTRYRLETTDEPPVAIVDGAVYNQLKGAYSSAFSPAFN
jgi:hypothetical protein